MEQHPIPQNISSYQFRLVGDMTLKQFFQLAGGILVGLMFYSSPLLGIIKWPFAIVSVILGIALAFLPFEERPLEKWIFAFFRAIYSPTLYYWQKVTIPPKFFQDEPTTAQVSVSEDVINETLSSKGHKDSPLDKLEQAEKSFLSKIMGAFSGTAVPTPVAQLVQQPQVLPQPIKPLQTATSIASVPTPPIDKPVENNTLQIPTTKPIEIPRDDKPKFVTEEKVTISAPIQDLQTSQVAPTIAGNEMVSTRSAVFSIDAAPPNPPTTPNVVVGQVIDQNKRIVEGAIMEIRDTAGRPIRALRSNKLGHFITVTPLDSGRYEIITEKDQFEFSPVSFETNGNIIPPILVQGKNLVAAMSLQEVVLAQNL